MRLWYLSYNRFENRIIKSWDKKGFKYNSSHVGILKYAFRTVQYYSNIERQKVSKANKFESHTLTIF